MSSLPLRVDATSPSPQRPSDGLTDEQGEKTETCRTPWAMATPQGATATEGMDMTGPSQLGDVAVNAPDPLVDPEALSLRAMPSVSVRLSQRVPVDPGGVTTTRRLCARIARLCGRLNIKNARLDVYREIYTLGIQSYLLKFGTTGPSWHPPQSHLLRGYLDP